MNLQQGVSPTFLDSMLCASVQFRAPHLCGSSWLRNPFTRFISILEYSGILIPGLDLHVAMAGLKHPAMGFGKACHSNLSVTTCCIA